MSSELLPAPTPDPRVTWNYFDEQGWVEKAPFPRDNRLWEYTSDLVRPDVAVRASLNIRERASPTADAILIPLLRDFRLQSRSWHIGINCSARVRRKNLLSSGSRSEALTFRRLLNCIAIAQFLAPPGHFCALLLATLRWNVSFYAPFVGTITRNYNGSERTVTIVTIGCCAHFTASPFRHARRTWTPRFWRRDFKRTWK